MGKISNVSVGYGFINGERDKLDYYATDPQHVRQLLDLEEFTGVIWEIACGDGRLAVEMKKTHSVAASDIVDREYGDVLDFFSIKPDNGDLPEGFNIVTNPPYGAITNRWIEHGMEILTRI